MIVNHFELDNKTGIDIKESELYKLIIPNDIMERVLKGDVEFLKDKSGAQLAMLRDKSGRKIVANARLEKVDIDRNIDKSTKSINDLVMQNMILELSQKLDSMDIKLDKLLQIEDNKLKSKFTSSMSLYEQAMDYYNIRLKIDILTTLVKELNSGMDLAYKSAKDSIDIIYGLPNKNILRSLKMSIPGRKYSKENILKELDNLYNKAQLIYTGTILLSNVYLELGENERVINKSMLYLKNILKDIDSTEMYPYICDLKCQEIIESGFVVIDNMDINSRLIKNGSDVYINVYGKKILEMYEGESI